MNTPPKPIQQVLKDVFHQSEFRPLQKDIVDACLTRKDVFVVLPTGYGKSLTFQLPALVQDGFTIVISPLIALISDQVNELRRLNVQANTINSTQTKREREQIKSDVIDGSCKLLYISPEQCLSPAFQSFIFTVKPLVDRIVVDEAHCAVEWGADFRKDYAKLGPLLRSQMPTVPLTALTGTASPNLRSQIVKTLQLRNPETFVGPNRRPQLHYEVRYEEDYEDKVKNVIKFINFYRSRLKSRPLKPEQGYPGCGIIYCRTKSSTQELADAINMKLGKCAVAYHADLSHETRNLVLNEWLKGNPDYSIVVATIAFGLGINKNDTRFIIHFNMPSNLEAYVQQTGRAGRDRKAARCILYYSSADSQMCIRFAQNKLKNKDGNKESNQDNGSFNSTKALVNYAKQIRRCRHSVLDEYFGDYENAVKLNCDYACDYCKDPKVLKLRYNQWFDNNS